MKSIVCFAVIALTMAAAGAQTPAIAQSIAPRVTPPSDDVPPPPIPVPVDWVVMRTRYAQAHWTYPTSKDMKDAYPPKAWDAEVEGDVQIICFIKPDGHMSRCVAQKESPSGYGFGSATVDLFLKTIYVDPATVDGGIQPNDFKIFVYRWQIALS